MTTKTATTTATETKQTTAKNTATKAKQPTLKDRFKVGDRVQARRNRKEGTVTEVKQWEIKITWDGDTKPRPYSAADLTTVDIDKIGIHKDWPSIHWEKDSPAFPVPGHDRTLWAQWVLTSARSGKLIFHSESEMKPESLLKACEISLQDSHKYQAISTAATELAKTLEEKPEQSTASDSAAVPAPDRNPAQSDELNPNEIELLKALSGHPDGLTGSELSGLMPSEVLQKIDLRVRGKLIEYSYVRLTPKGGYKISKKGQDALKAASPKESESNDAPMLIKFNAPDDELHGKIFKVDSILPLYYACYEYADNTPIYEDRKPIHIHKKSAEIVSEAAANNDDLDKPENKPEKNAMLNLETTPIQSTNIPVYDYAKFTNDTAQKAQQTAYFERDMVTQDFKNRLRHGEMLLQVATELEAQHGTIKGKKVYIEWLKSPVVGKYGKVEAMRNRTLYEWFNQCNEKVQQLLLEKAWQLGIEGLIVLAKLPEHLQALLPYLLQHVKEINKAEIKKAVSAFAIGGKVKVISGQHSGKIGTLQTVPEGKYGAFELLLESGETCRLLVIDCLPWEAAPKPEKVRAKKEDSEAVQAMKAELEISRERISQLEKEVEENRADKAQIQAQEQKTNKLVSILGLLAKQLGWEVDGKGDLLANLDAFASSVSQAKSPQSQANTPQLERELIAA